MGNNSVLDSSYSLFGADPSAAFASVVSPASADSIVGPPPDGVPDHQPGQGTPLTGNLAAAPKQAVAKNLDTQQGRSAYTGVSNPPNGGFGATTSVQPAQVMRPAQTVQPAQNGMQPAQINPDPGGFARPGGTSPAMPVLPQSTLQPAKGPSQLDLDQSKLANLTNSGSGVSQIKNPFLRGLARVGDVAGSILAPGVAAAIPGTTLHHQQLLGQQQAIVGNDLSQQQAEAQTADTNQQTAQRAATAAKETAQAGANVPRPVTADEARAAGNPALEGSVMRPSDIGKVAVQGVKNVGQVDKQDDPDSYQAKNAQSLEDVRQTQQVLNQAKANAANADPSTPAGKLALAKLAEASRGHTAAMMRAQASMGNYLMHSRGVGLDNQALPGQFQISDDKGNVSGLGTSFQKPVSDQQSRVAQFNDVFGALGNFEGAAKALAKSGGKLNDPQVAAALADPHSTSAQWAQGAFANSGLSPAQRNYVISKKAFDENLQAMRKSAGGTATDAAVNRLAAMAPGAQTPDLDYFLRQTGQIRQTAQRLSRGIPNVKGGQQVQTGAPASSGNHEVWVRDKNGKLVKQ